MSTISHKELKDLNWLPVITRFEQCAISIWLKFINGNYQYYLNEVFEFESSFKGIYQWELSVLLEVKFLNLNPKVIMLV